MARTKRIVKPLPTIWRMPEELWARALPLLLEFWPAKPTGRKLANWRSALDGILFSLRSGCRWDQPPREFGPTRIVHDWFQRGSQGGVFERIWALLVEACAALGAVDWRWQRADGAMGKARCGGEKG